MFASIAPTGCIGKGVLHIMHGLRASALATLMSVQKQYSKPGYASFCPVAPLIVAGTAVYGHLDEAYTPQPILEILSLDLAKPGLELPRVGASVNVKSPVLTLEWGTFGIAAKKSKVRSPGLNNCGIFTSAHQSAESDRISQKVALQYGILAGSLSSGEVVLWDPMAIVNSATASPAINTWKPRDNGRVNALTFNPQTPSILACGTSTGEVMLYDITNPHEPKDFMAGQDSSAGSKSSYAPQFRNGSCDVLSLKFNNVSSHIVAIGFANGATHLYDTRNRRKLMEFVDENLPRRISGVVWSPTDETRLVLASEDDRSPTLQFWDLRKARAPTLEFVGHSRGVTDVAWCPQDSGLLLSSGKDSQSIVWDTRSGERLGCFHPSEPGPAIQVSWSPINHGMFLSSQAGRAVHLAHYTGVACSFEAVADPATGQLVTQRVPRALPKPPAWMRRRSVARFGFGGKLAVAQPPVRGDNVRAVTVKTVTLEPELKAQSEAFEEAMSGDLQSYCLQKASVEADPEKEYWSFIEVLLQSEDQRSRGMLSLLGFANEVAASARPGASEQVENAAALLNAASLISDPSAFPDDPAASSRPFFDADNPPGNSPRPGDKTPVAGGASSFFDNLGATTVTPTAASGRGQGSLAVGPNTSIGDSGALESEAEGETELQRHLFVGNHAAAVAVCLSHDRLADALVVAHVANDPALWQSTLSRYTELCPQPYLRVVEAQMREDYESLIKTRPVGRWAETAAILLTYLPQQDFKRLCTKLAKRLDESGMRHAAALCYICCADVDAAVTLWLSDASDASLPVPRLQSILEKSIALCLAATNQAATASLADLLVNYALRLVDQGAVRSAVTYLGLLDSLQVDSAPNLAVLKDRVMQCNPYEVPETIAPVGFPFEYVPVPTSAEGLTAQHEIYDAYTQQQQHQQQHYTGYGAQSGYIASSATSHYHQTPFQNNYAYTAGSTGQSYNQYKYEPSGYSADQSYVAQSYVPSEPKQAPLPPAPAKQSLNTFTTQPSYNAPGLQRSTSTRSPQSKSYAPPPAKPVVPPTQAPVQPAYTTHAPVAPPQPAFSSRVTPQPQQFSPKTQPYAQTPPQPVPEPVKKAPAVFQPTHAAPPTMHAIPPRQSAPAVQNPPPAAAPPPPPPSGPPSDCTIYNVETSACSGAAQQIVRELFSLFQACEPLAQHAVQQRELEDNARKLGILFWKLNAGEVSAEVLALLQPLAQALTSGDIAAAKQIHVKLTGSHWSECSQWLQVMKRLMKARQQLQ